jgi:hypothetical protein
MPNADLREPWLKLTYESVPLILVNANCFLRSPKLPLTEPGTIATKNYGYFLRDTIFRVRQLSAVAIAAGSVQAHPPIDVQFDYLLSRQRSWREVSLRTVLDQTNRQLAIGNGKCGYAAKASDLSFSAW